MTREDEGNSRVGYKSYDYRQDHISNKDRNDKKEEVTPQGNNLSSDRPPLRGAINTIFSRFAKGGSLM